MNCTSILWPIVLWLLQAQLGSTLGRFISPEAEPGGPLGEVTNISVNTREIKQHKFRPKLFFFFLPNDICLTFKIIVNLFYFFKILRFF